MPSRWRMTLPPRTKIQRRRRPSSLNRRKAHPEAESIAQKLANLKQQSELAADSTNKLSREQAILNAQQSLGKGATKEQIALAGQYAAKNGTLPTPLRLRQQQRSFFLKHARTLVTDRMLRI